MLASNTSSSRRGNGFHWASFALCWTACASVHHTSQQLPRAVPKLPVSAAAATDCRPPALLLRLPFGDSHAHRVRVGNTRSAQSGEHDYSWDFDVAEGDPIVAAADGVVVEVTDSFTAGGPDPALGKMANVIWIDHGSARFSIYGHLAPNSAVVAQGQHVRRGQLIARAGRTGFTPRPDLFFAVVDFRWRSLPACFPDSRKPIPTTGDLVAAPSPPDLPSALPRDAFVENGVRLTADLPAHVFWGGEHVEGVALRSAKKAVVLLAPRVPGPEPRVLFGEIDEDHRFNIAIHQSDLALVGPLIRFAVTLETADGKWQTPFSVPITLGDTPPPAADDSPTSSRNQIDWRAECISELATPPSCEVAGIYALKEARTNDADALLRRGCDHDEGCACSALALFLERTGKSSDVKVLYQKGCRLECGAACIALGDAALDGKWGQPKDPAAASSLFERACRVDPEGCNVLGLRALGRHDLVAAKNDLSAGCDRGFSGACTNLAMAMTLGMLPPDPAPRRLFAKACLRGDRRVCTASGQAALRQIWEQQVLAPPPK